ncbi:hypothetical protein D3C77_422160 [compost metagenome]
MEETNVAAYSTFQYPLFSTRMIAIIDRKLRISPQIIVLFGFHRSASAPPINEKTKIGKYSITVIKEIAIGSSPFVCSMMKYKMAILRIQMARFCNMSELVTIRNALFLNKFVITSLP